MFRTLKELVKALRDIVMIQQTAVQERGILHRDCSLNNAMILDFLDTSMGFLIDWEFAVRISPDDRYTIGGTGTIPFMSRRLLRQILSIQENAETGAKGKLKAKVRKSKSKDTPALKIPKSSSDSLALPVSRVMQDYSDDLESLFFVFSWISTKFSGPNGEIRQKRITTALLDRWASLDLQSCAAFKVSLFADASDGKRLIDEFDSYFAPLIPLAKDWYAALKDNMNNRVTFDTILDILNSHLDQLPDDEERQSTVTMFKKSATIINTSVLKRVASLSLPAEPSERKKPKISESDERM